VGPAAELAQRVVGTRHTTFPWAASCTFTQRHTIRCRIEDDSDPGARFWTFRVDRDGTLHLVEVLHEQIAIQ
jgi:hypothetical protein